MNNSASVLKKVRWKWILIALVIDVMGLVPMPDPGRNPGLAWLTMIAFPFQWLYGWLYLPSLRALPQQLIWLCGPLLVYGVLLATVAQGPRWRIWFYSIACFHTTVAMVACVKTYQLW
jgi:hypothetical protein